MKDKLAKMQGKHIAVRARGIEYRGYYVGADEERLYLRAKTGWITLPLDAVSAARLVESPGWEHKKIEGEREPDEAEREGKRRFGRLDLDKVHDRQAEWPAEESGEGPAEE